jgi:hypothetical protein
MLLAMLTAGELYFNFGFLGQAGLSKGKDYTTPDLDINWLKTDFLSGGSFSIGYQYSFSNWFVDFNFLGLEMSNPNIMLRTKNDIEKNTSGLLIEAAKTKDLVQVKKALKDSQNNLVGLCSKYANVALFFDILLPTQVKLGKHIGRFSVYGLFNPFSFSLFRYMHLQELKFDLGVTLGAGVKYRLSPLCSLIGEVKVTHDYYAYKATDLIAYNMTGSGKLADTEGFKGFTSKPTAFKFLIGMELGKRAV